MESKLLEALKAYKEAKSAKHDAAMAYMQAKDALLAALKELRLRTKRT